MNNYETKLLEQKMLDKEIKDVKSAISELEKEISVRETALKQQQTVLRLLTSSRKHMMNVEPILTRKYPAIFE